MKHISRKINLSQYKSFLQSKIVSVKDNEIVDITKQNNQIKYNALSNYSMMPLTCRVRINVEEEVQQEEEVTEEVQEGEITKGKELLWAWHTLHKIYVFFKNTEKDDICWENESSYSEYLEILNIDSEDFKKYFDDLKTDIVDYVENNKNGNLIDFKVIDKNYEPCNYETDTYITIPLSITNNIDNLGQMSNLIDDWQEKTKYHKGNVAVFDNKDWRLNNTGSTAVTNYETFIDGYTWNDKYKESVFGNLTFDDKLNQYVYKKVKKEDDEADDVKDNDDLQWERNIKHSIDTNGNIHSAFLEGKYLDGDILTYTYLDNEYILNPNKSKTAKKYPIIKPKLEFIVDNNIVYLIEDYYFVENFGCEDNKLLVQFDCGVPFIEFKGERFYGYVEKEKLIDSDGNVYEINDDKVTIGDREYTITEEKIIDGDIEYPIVEGKVIIGDKEYENKSWVYKFEYKLMAPWEAIKKQGFFYNDIFCEKEGTVIVLGKNYRTYEVCDANYGYVIINESVVLLKDGKTPYMYEYSPSNDDDSTQTIFSSEEFKLKENTNWVLSDNYEVDENGDYFKVYRDYKEHVLNYVSGTTASQLSMFKLPNIFDNLGKEFAATFSEPNASAFPLEDANDYKDETSGETSDIKPLYVGVLRPIVNDYLSLQYKTGTTNNLSLESENKYWGNILANIEFFVTDSSGERLYTFEPTDKSTGDQLKEIYEKYTLKYKDYQLKVTNVKEKGDLEFDDALSTTNSSLNVQFTYYVGAIIEEIVVKVKVYDEIYEVKDGKVEIKGKIYEVKDDKLIYKETDENGKDITETILVKTTKKFSLTNNAHKGVEYTEIYTVKRVEDIYGRGRHNKYKVYRFELIGEPLDDEFDGGDGASKAYFKTELPIYKKVENYVVIDGSKYVIKYPIDNNKITINNIEYIVDGNVIYNYDENGKLNAYQIFTESSIVDNNHFKEGENGDFDPYRGFIASPTIMHEYNLGTAYQEKIFENIYIDRGASSAFEKHLKLQEIETLQDLENYSNGGFFSIASVN